MQFKDAKKNRNYFIAETDMKKNNLQNKKFLCLENLLNFNEIFIFVKFDNKLIRLDQFTKQLYCLLLLTLKHGKLMIKKQKKIIT